MAALPQTTLEQPPEMLGSRITAEKVRQAVRLAVEAYDPVRVIAFGSWARGEAGPDSDLDLAVIVEDQADESRWRRSVLSYDNLLIPFDLILATKTTHQRFAYALDNVHHDIATEGVVLYERDVCSSESFYPTPSKEELLSIQSESLAVLAKRAVADEKALNLDGQDVEIAAFHGQQALEKWLKIWLTAIGVAPPRIHELEDLAKKLSENGAELPLLPVNLVEVTEYAATWRYSPPPGSDELDLAPLREAVKLLREHVRGQLVVLGIDIPRG